MKRIISILISTMILIPSIIFADDIPTERQFPRLVDYAGLLTDEDNVELSNKLDEISERQNLDVVIVTIDSIGEYTATQYADNFFDYGGYGKGDDHDGILLLLNMEERDWAISTTGYGITAFTDAGQEYIIDQIIGDLGEGYYADAFYMFAELCDIYITQANTGEPYDVESLPKKPVSLIWIPVSIGLAMIISFLITGKMKSKLKTVNMQYEASNYIKANSLKLRDSKDFFLYSKIDKVARPKENKSSSKGGGGSSTHTSSSGRSHGGSSGKF